MAGVSAQLGVPITELQRLGADLLRSAGMDAEKADSVARLLVLTDAMGRRTHGLAMLPLYLADIRKGGMAVSGEPEVVRDNGVSAVWDAGYLPGLWVMERAIQQAMPRAQQFGVAVIAIRRTHHIGCLAALARIATDREMIAQIWNSDPAGQRVAPFGGTEAVFTPDPMALGYPGPQHPVLVDICASITTTSMTRQKVAAGEQFAQPWLQDADGRPTTDPRVLEHSDPRGALLPIGGHDYGHKGYGLALMNEALSQGLSGHGRRDAPKRWGGNVLLQVLDPQQFAGLDAFVEQTAHISDLCRNNRPIDPAKPVRVPGDQAAAGIARAQAEGICFDAATWQALTRCAVELGVAMPAHA